MIDGHDEFDPVAAVADRASTERVGVGTRFARADARRARGPISATKPPVVADRVVFVDHELGRGKRGGARCKQGDHGGGVGLHR